MRDVFSCNKCHSIYGITRLQQKPILPPRCQVCFASFPPSELGDWLAYERAEPEWTVGEWLGVPTSQLNLPSPHQRLAGLMQRKIESPKLALPSSQLQKLPAFGTARTPDER
jgi:hypothetical protein